MIWALVTVMGCGGASVSSRENVLIRALMSVDVLVRRAEAFSWANDIA